MSTLRDLINSGTRIALYHERINPLCTHGSMLDLEALAARFGDDFDLALHKDWFLARLRCSACGGKGNMTLRVHPATTPDTRRQGLAV